MNVQNVDQYVQKILNIAFIVIIVRIFIIGDINAKK